MSSAHSGGEKLGFSSLRWEGEQGGSTNDPILPTESMTWEFSITYIGVEIFGEIRPVVRTIVPFPPINQCIGSYPLDI